MSGKPKTAAGVAEWKAKLSAARLIHGHARPTGGQHSRTYQSWMSMKGRCNYTPHKSFDDYGGRGIRYAPEWAEFSAFLRDMGERPPGTTLGRIDNAGDYGPGNCRWESWKEQARNRRSSRWLTFRGQTKTLAEWAEVTGLTEDSLQKRLDSLNWPVERALTQPPRPQKNSKCRIVVKDYRLMVSEAQQPELFAEPVYTCPHSGVDSDPQKDESLR